MIYTVSEVNHMAADFLAANPLFNGIQVNGEISGGKLYPSGHYYFTIKDDKATLSGVMFRSAYSALNFQPKNGDKVTLKGNLTIYEKGGRFQVIVQSIQPQGVGDLHKEFELLKKDLAKQGYFSEETKKPLPFLPECIGVATSSAGAVLQDIIHVLRRRFPGFQMHFIPVAVQGQGAAKQIARAIYLFNKMDQVDVIIIGRGGGSIEDLWAFNEKIVADAIHQSHIPVISAVGHETDFSIADFTADLRAPTPSAAAELVLPEKKALYDSIHREEDKLRKALKGQLDDARKSLTYLIDRPIFQQPKRSLDQNRQIIDDLTNSLLREFKHKTHNEKQLLLNLRSSLETSIRRILEIYHQMLVNNQARLKALNPFAVLDRGYTYVTNEDGVVVDSVRKIEKGQLLSLHWSDGHIRTEVKEINNQEKK